MTVKRLIGSNPSQISRNKDLGTLAFMDADSLKIQNGTIGAESLTLDSLYAIKGTYARALFVYDTSKDTDGGAWRSSCQNTTWYNEPLNTSIRGSRRDFPSVVVIVSDDNNTILYDGDDPQLSMWMVFPHSGLHIGGYPLQASSTRPVYDLCMLNGMLAVAINADGSGTQTGWTGLVTIDFVKEFYRQNYALGYLSHAIADRASPITYFNAGGSGDVYLSTAVYRCQTVSLAVAPDTPVDPVTNLQPPTILVSHGTNSSGKSWTLIKPDLTTIIGNSLNNSWNPAKAIFDNNLTIWHGEFNDWAYGGMQYTPWPWSNPQGAGSGSNQGYTTKSMTQGAYGTNPAWPRVIGGDIGHHAPTEFGIVHGSRGMTSGSSPVYDPGISILRENLDDRSLGMVAYIGKDYTTGYLHGSSRGAWMCEANKPSVTNLNGAEVVTNGTFTNNASGWTVSSSADGSFSASGGQLTITNNDATDPPVYVWQAIPTTPGEIYTITAQKTGGTVNEFALIVSYTSTTAGSILNVAGSASTLQLSGQFRARDDVSYVLLRVNANTAGTVIIDNVSCRLGVADQAYTAKGLQVIPTGNSGPSIVPVNTGCDLMCYTNFDNGYLYQPNSSYIQELATGDFYIMGWAKSNSTVMSTQTIVNITDGTKSINIGRATSNGATVNNSIFCGFYGPNTTVSFGGDNYKSIMYPNVWRHIAVVRTGNTFKLYMDGILVQSATGDPGALTSTASYLRFGYGFTVTSMEMSMTLWRMGKTVPSDSQMMQIYKDEVNLFKPNTKATIFGGTGIVKALAYDYDTKEIHVGTAFGRSTFNGLTRTNNTTTPVSGLISAVNGFIVEQ